MNRKTLTPEMLRTIVLEEMAKLHEEKKLKKVEDVKAKEVEADEYADTLEHHVDMLRVLGVKEAKLRAQLAAIEERRRQLIKKIG